jgi:hypothetical protein
VRYVYQDGQFGVVGIPENTDRWPTHYRRQADALMARHFPEGHEIVRAEEVVEGSRTLKVEGSNTAELAPQLPTALINIAKLGHTASRSQADTLKIKECRIVYRRAEAIDAEVQPGYADSASLAPAPYIDPNAEARQKSGDPGRATSIAEAEAKPSDAKDSKPAAAESKPAPSETLAGR